jgi:heme exporter protein A
MDPAAFTGTDLACLRGSRMVFVGLDFVLQPGGALLLLGPNGSGKSSLLRLMAGLLRPFRGDMTWRGTSLKDEPDALRGHVHYVGHADAVKPVLTAAENLKFWAAMDNRPDPGAAALQALTTLGVGHIAETPGRFLSAGQKRRLNLARVLAVPAPLWLLDEPTVALDKAGVKLLEGVIDDHRRRGGMVVLSTHADIALPGATALHLDDFTPQADDEEDDA